MSAAAQALRHGAADALQRLWLVTRFGCCVQVFHDYVVEATVVRQAARAAAARGDAQF
jgi:hypothetical protein